MTINVKYFNNIKTQTIPERYRPYIQHIHLKEFLKKNTIDSNRIIGYGNRNSMNKIEEQYIYNSLFMIIHGIYFDSLLGEMCIDPKIQLTSEIIYWEESLYSLPDFICISYLQNKIYYLNPETENISISLLKEDIHILQHFCRKYLQKNFPILDYETLSYSLFTDEYLSYFITLLRELYNVKDELFFYIKNNYSHAELCDSLETLFTIIDIYSNSDVNTHKSNINDNNDIYTNCIKDSCIVIEY
jgi:hypothetical protein